eukprot:4466140-Alexandrium_andersonii.AAC.1
MSASLVGSEMCIRDSIYRQTHTRRCKRLQQVAAVCSGLLSGLPGRATACLLYTSDAADDM